MKKFNVEEYLDPKKDEIYESMDIDSPSKEFYKDSKRGTKLQIFLSQLDNEIEEQMFNFLQVNQQKYEQNRQNQKILLYEDILFIWSFKKEADLLNKNKKQTSERLLAELEEVTKKKKVTIKERIQKKLCNLTAGELIQYMRTNRDITFDKKNVNLKKIESKTNPSSKSLSFNSQNNLANMFKNQKVTNVNSKQRTNQKPEKQDTAQRLCPLKVICSKDTVPQHQDNQVRTAPDSRSSSSIYKYGSTSISQKIYICYTKQNNEFVAFKKSAFDDFAAQNQINDKTKNLINNNSNQILQPMIEPSANNIQSHADLANPEQLQKQQTVFSDINLKMIEEFLQKKGGQLNQVAQPQKIQGFLNYIQDVKSKARTTLQNLKDFQLNDQNQSNIKKVQNYINTIENLQNNLIQQKEASKTAVVASDPAQQTESNKSEKKYLINNQHAIQTGKKTVASMESPEKEFQTKCEADNNSADLKKLFYMMNNNIIYLNIVKEDNSKCNNYIWSTDQDTLLMNFKINPTFYKQEMVCLLRYKTLNFVLERYQFLQMEVDSKLSVELQNLGTKNKEQAIQDKPHAMC